MKPMDKVVIVGTGGLASEVASWCADAFEVVGYLNTDGDDHLPGWSETVYSEETIADAGTNLAVMAIAKPAVKARVHARLTEQGFRFPTFVHPSSVVAASSQLEDGVFIAPNCTVAPKARLGKLVYLNFGCGIGHDAVIGDFTQMNPGVQLGGATNVDELVLIGSGATVLQGVAIGEGATVGSGSVVFSDVLDGATVMGNPAKRMRAFE